MLTDHSTCRWRWTQGIALAGCAARRVRAGSWAPWGHSPPPGCQGYAGKEEGYSSVPRGTPEAETGSIRHQDTINTSSHRLRLSHRHWSLTEEVTFKSWLPQTLQALLLQMCHRHTAGQTSTSGQKPETSPLPSTIKHFMMWHQNMR